MMKRILLVIFALTFLNSLAMDRPLLKPIQSSAYVDEDQLQEALPGAAKPLCIACAKAFAQNARKERYQCGHEIHAECFAQKNHLLQNCYACQIGKANLPKEAQSSSSSWWPFGGQKLTPASELHDKLFLLQEENKQLKGRLEELTFNAQLLSEQLEVDRKKRIELRSELQDALGEKQQALDAIIHHLRINQIAAQIEKYSWLAGGAAALIAYNRKYSVNKCALIGVGTALTPHLFALIYQLKNNQ